MDLHTHSSMSDGKDTPSELVRNAVREGMDMLALSDHDCIDGLEEANRTAETEGILFLPSLEMDTDYSEELHILGLDVDPHSEQLAGALQAAKEGRDQRNVRMVEKLAEIGCETRDVLEKLDGVVTRADIARAVVEKGFADSVSDAFEKYLVPGRPCFIPMERISPENAIRVIHGAGGVAVIAHPCNLKCDSIGLIRELYGLGLDGIEAYYRTATPGQTETYRSLAKQLGIMVTCGSDYHGANRPGVRIGCAWREADDLLETYRFFKDRISAR